MTSSLSRRFQSTLFWLILLKSKEWESLKFLIKTMDSALWENAKLFAFFKSIFYQSKMPRFLSARFSNTLSWAILLKNIEWGELKFLTKTMDQPLLKNVKLSTFLNRCLKSLKWLFSYVKFQNTLFWPILP